MAEKRYQVFVSSTFKDLQEERWEAVKALMALNCIVAGMEFFSAVDEEQFSYIKSVIDECDYCVLILGGRYGSIAPDGLGYTEKEYEYAKSKGIRVIALVYKMPEALPPEKRETDPEKLSLFNAFRDRVCASCLVSYWTDIRDIQKEVMQGFFTARTRYPAIGWVRANTVASEEILREINELRKENIELKKSIQTRENKYIEFLQKCVPFSYNIGGEEKIIDIPLIGIFITLGGLFNANHSRPFSDIRNCIIEIIIAQICKNIDINATQIVVNHETVKQTIAKLTFLDLIQTMDDNANLFNITDLGKRVLSEIVLNLP